SHSLVRALASPWPGAFTTLGRDTLILRRVALANGGDASAPPGIVSAVDRLGVRVGTGAGDLLIVGAEIGGRAADLHALGLSPGTRLRPWRSPGRAARSCPSPIPPRRRSCARATACSSSPSCS